MTDGQEEPSSVPGPDRPQPGTLYLIPTPLGAHGTAADCLPASAIAIASRLDYFVAENARSARAFLKLLPSQYPLQAIEIRELNEHSDARDLPALLAPLLAGRDAGVLSEAGCPAIADPGAGLVALAHRQQVRVVPLTGPSSLTLTLMASGLNGQRFAFAGYAPVKDEERTRFLRELEQRSSRWQETQLLIETPYRAQALLDALLAVLAADTDLVVASELTQPAERIERRRIADWRRVPVRLGKVPAVFALLAAPRAAARPPLPAGGAAAGSVQHQRLHAKPKRPRH